ncbi:helix-turn-helix transcriptional regulator [Dongia sedimenti]|uniref:AraC family transcriptional regulator n=1 Tax=Dongia sedimenti TaxID=3064282 RepID=A0ABU0YQD2_9PROT|nr:AraC family transcriptional regulator [Rhodospirillaceae bacterium R-7]
MNALALDLRSYPGEAHAHDHPYHQVILALEGGLDMEIGGRAGRVDSARGALVPAGTLHAFAGVGQNRFVTLDIGRTSAAAPVRLLAASTPYFTVPRAIEHLLAYVGSRASDLGQDADHIAPLLAAALVEPSAESQAPRAVLKATAFMRRAYPHPIANDDIARAAGISTAHLHALFKQWLGSTPGRTLGEIRLDRAKDRLAGGEPIVEIALGVGFSEQSAFTRAFRRRFGESPAAYRRRLESRHRTQ